MIKSSVVSVDGDKKCEVEMNGMASDILMEFGIITQSMFENFKDEPNLIVSLIAKAAAKAKVSPEELL